MKKKHCYSFLYDSNSYSLLTKEIYLTPEVTGYIYNNATKEPLRQQKGFIGFNGLTPNDAPELVSNKDGSFTLKPIAKKYYFFKPACRNTLIWLH